VKKSDILLGALLFTVASSLWSGEDRRAEVATLAVGVLILMELERGRQ